MRRRNNDIFKVGFGVYYEETKRFESSDLVLNAFNSWSIRVLNRLNRK
jgi:hypothetical protein